MSIWMTIGVVQLSQVYVYGPIFIYVEKFDHLPHLLPHLIILNKMYENYLPASPNKAWNEKQNQYPQHGSPFAVVESLCEDKKNQ